MKIIVLGGDGFCGWPTALHLANLGHEVTIVDNLSRRHIDIELEAGSLTPIRPLGERVAAWKEVTGRAIDVHSFTVGEHYHRLLTLIEESRPDTIIHFAEQRAAPYSMKSASHKRYTVNNNLNATHDVCAAIAESGLDVHLVHLPFPQPIGRRTLKAVWSRQLRWARLRRVTFPVFFCAELVVGGVFPIIVAAALAAAEVIPFWLVAAYAVAWYGAEVLMAIGLGWRAGIRPTLALIVRDLSLPVLWVAAVSGSGFEWRGNQMNVKEDSLAAAD